MVKKQVFNPYLPSWEYIPDGEPRVFGDRLYIFGSHDRFNGADYCENDYVSWSAPVTDLSDWRYEGVIFEKTQTPWNADGAPMFAPDVVQGADGRFYLFYSVKDSSIVSVAVCSRPAGRYEYLGDIRTKEGRVYGSSPSDWFLFDPSVLVDGNRIWLYAGSGQPSNGQYGHEIKGCFVMELEADMLTIQTEPKVLLPADYSLKKPNFFEGASARHIGGWYYIVYPATNMTGLNYAMSRYPDRDFVHQGAIHSTSDVGLDGRKPEQAVYPIGNNHGGLACMEGEWYVFDHRMTNGNQYSRQGVAEKIQIQEDGTIAMVESTSCGLNRGPLEGRGTYPAYIACHLTSKWFEGRYGHGTTPVITQEGDDYCPKHSFQEGSVVNAQTESAAPVSYIGRIADKSEIGYKYFDLSQTKRVTITVRHGNGRVDILNHCNGEVVGRIPIKNTNDWASFGTDVDAGRWTAAGKKDGKDAYPLFFRYEGSGEMEMLEFTLS